MALYNKYIDKDGYIDLVNDYIEKNIDRIVSDYWPEVVNALDQKGYIVREKDKDPLY